MDNDTPPDEKKDIPRWLDRLFTIAGSTIVLTVIAVPTFFNKVDNLNSNVADLKKTVVALRGDISTLSEKVGRARVEDVEKIGRIDGRLAVVEKTMTLITMNRWNQPEK